MKLRENLHEKQVPKQRGSKIMTVWWKKAAFLPLLYLSIGKKMLSLTIRDVKGRDFFFEIKASKEVENRGSRTGNGKLDSHLSGETILEAHERSPRVGWEGNRQDNRGHKGGRRCVQSSPVPWSRLNFLDPTSWHNRSPSLSYISHKTHSGFLKWSIQGWERKEQKVFQLSR